MADNTIYIAVMGVTGAGKSSLIQNITQNRNVVIGHGLASQTQTTTPYNFYHSGHNYVLLDCPGFNDTKRSDEDILEDITTWLSTNYGHQKLLSGILYLHPISDARVQGSTMTQFRVFKELCGEEFYSNVVLGTTFWSTVSKNDGEARELELFSKTGLLGDMKNLGAEVVRISENRADCLRLIQRFASKSKKSTRVQKELAKSGKKFKDTSAAKLLVSLHIQARGGWRAKLDRVRQRRAEKHEKIELLRQKEIEAAQAEQARKEAEQKHAEELRRREAEKEAENRRLMLERQAQEERERARIQAIEANAAQQREAIRQHQIAAQAEAARIAAQQAEARAALEHEQYLARAEQRRRIQQDRKETNRYENDARLRAFDVERSRERMSYYAGNFLTSGSCGQPGCGIPLRNRYYHWCSGCEVYACTACWNAEIRLYHGIWCLLHEREGCFGGMERAEALEHLGLEAEDEEEDDDDDDENEDDGDEGGNNGGIIWYRASHPPDCDDPYVGTWRRTDLSYSDDDDDDAEEEEDSDDEDSDDPYVGTWRRDSDSDDAEEDSESEQGYIIHWTADSDDDDD